MIQPRTLLVAAALAGLVSLAGASRARDQAAIPSAGAVPALDARLRALRPDRAMDYFELAEEVAYEIPTDRGRALARRLYITAFELDRSSASPVGLGSSTCLALADLAPSAAERRWLRALAQALEPDNQSVDWATASPADAADGTPDRIALAITQFREQDYRRVRDALRRIDAVTVMTEAGVDPLIASRLVTQLEHTVDDVPFCPACQNRRTVRTPDGGRINEELCPLCRGNPGPRLDEADLRRTLAVEATLLEAHPGTWSGQLLADGIDPLPDIDADQLAAWFDVSTDDVYWQPAEGTGWPYGEWSDAPPEDDEPAGTGP